MRNSSSSCTREVMLGRVSVDAARIERFRRLLHAAGANAAGDDAAALAVLYRDTYRQLVEPLPAQLR